MMFESDLEKMNGVQFSTTQKKNSVQQSSDDFVFNWGGLDFDEDEFSTKKKNDSSNGIYV